MKQNAKNTNGESTPTNGQADHNGNGNGAPAVVLTSSLLPSFPRIAEPTSLVVRFGDETLEFPIDNDGGKVAIDAAMFSGKGTLRLKNIKTALKIAGKANTAEGRAWFNEHVRDNWHAALKFANRDAMKNGKPVSLGLSRRVKTSKQGLVTKTLTAKFGYELVEESPSRKAVAEATAQAEADKAKADKAKAKQSAKRAKRQSRKGLVKVGDAITQAVEITRVNPLENTAPTTQAVAA